MPDNDTLRHRVRLEIDSATYPNLHAELSSVKSRFIGFEILRHAEFGAALRRAGAPDALLHAAQLPQPVAAPSPGSAVPAVTTTQSTSSFVHGLSLSELDEFITFPAKT